MPIFDLYQINPNNRARFLLGKSGSRILIVIGLNPSIATNEKSDLTATKVEYIASANGFDGFAIVNLYAQRSTDPANLHKRCNSQLLTENLSVVESLLSHQSELNVWAAWGTGINKRRYLIQSFIALNALITQYGGRWLCYGKCTTMGHPRHPSRVAYGQKFSAFDANHYEMQLQL